MNNIDKLVIVLYNKVISNNKNEQPLDLDLILLTYCDINKQKNRRNKSLLYI